MDTWILVADAGRARIFVSSKKGEPWRLLEEFEHPESRMKNRDLDPMEQGRTKQAFGAGNRPRMEPTTAPQQVEKEHFAQLLADKLSQAVAEGACPALVAVAPPHFLGHLRSRLSDHAGKCLVATVDKDYTGSDARELAARLDDLVHAEHTPIGVN
ncbi:MAG TPA: host attachment protein [Pirellulales bacterium]|nr:host attachment protein [Pirellulales bacterium]